MILRDLHRTFPTVEMFRERGGHGQQMLGQVLRAFSVYDMQVGYCQGLAFLVGPLLMHMDERAAFCVLVRLMEEYDLRTMFTADMAGLHLRVFQFTRLLERFVPTVSNHLEELGVQNIYATQWFLSIFAVTCPLSMLLRIYDVIFAEGALETLMRVAVAIMQANEQRLLAIKEEDEALSLLLGRDLWQVYADDEGQLIADAMSLTLVASRHVLEDLENEYELLLSQNGRQVGVAVSPAGIGSAQPKATSEIHAAAVRFVGRIWSSYTAVAPSTATSESMRRASSLSEFEGSSSASSLYFDEMPRATDGELHRQIEDLVIALSQLQRQHASVAEELEAEKRARGEDRAAFQEFLKRSKDSSLYATSPGEQAEDDEEMRKQILDMQEKFSTAPESMERVATFKDLARQVDDARAETAFERERVGFLKRDLDSKCSEVRDLKDQLFEIKSRYQDAQRERSKYERMLNEVRQRQQTTTNQEDEYDYYDPTSPTASKQSPTALPSGLRELRLGRQNQTRSPQMSSSSTFSKRSSSLVSPEDVAAALLLSPNATPTLASIAAFASVQEEPQCENCESLKLELVTAKTNEVLARQECEETKNKLEKLKRSFAASTSIVSGGGAGNIAAPRSPRTSPGLNNESAWPKIGKFSWNR